MVVLVEVLIYKCSLWDEFQVKKLKYHLAFWTVLTRVFPSWRFRVMAISRWPILASVEDHAENNVSSPVMIRLRYFPSSSALLIRSPPTVKCCSLWSCVKMRGTLCCVIRDLLRSSDRILTCTMAKPCRCCEVIYRSGPVSTHQCCNSLILSSVRTVVGRSVLTSSWKLSLPRTKRLCHLNRTLWSEALSAYTFLIIWKVSLSDFKNFWQNFTLACLEFHRSHSIFTFERH